MEHKLKKINRCEVHFLSTYSAAQTYLERFHFAYELSCAINHGSLKLLEPLLHAETKLKFTGDDTIGNCISPLKKFKGKEEVMEHFEKLFDWFKQRPVITVILTAWGESILKISQQTYLNTISLQLTGDMAPGITFDPDDSVIRFSCRDSLISQIDIIESDIVLDSLPETEFVRTGHGYPAKKGYRIPFWDNYHIDTRKLISKQSLTWDGMLDLE